MTRVASASGCVFVQQTGTYEQQSAEVEIVAQTAFLIIDDRMWLTLSVGNRIKISINHSRTSIVSHAQHSVDSVLP